MSKYPIRILHFPSVMTRAGTQTLLMGVYRNIDRTQVQFDFVVDTQEPGDFDDEIARLGGRIFHVPAPRMASAWRYGQDVNWVLRSAGSFDGVHTHLYLFSGYILWLAQRRGIQMRLSHSHIDRDTKGDAWQRRGYRWLMQRLVRRYATHLLAPSLDAANSLFGEHCARGPRFRVIPNGIDLEPFRMPGADPRSQRARLGLPEHAKLLGHVGRFVKQKNHAFVIDVFSQLHHELPEAHLLLVGDGPLRPDIQRLTRQKGLSDQVHFLGVRSDVPEIMNVLDLFLFPSLYEGLGIVTIEAQAAGTPCLVSRAVPSEADTGMGNLHRIDLTEGADVWAAKAVEMMQYDRPEWSVREQALRAAGYDVRETARRLQEIYTGEKA